MAIRLRPLHAASTAVETVSTFGARKSLSNEFDTLQNRKKLWDAVYGGRVDETRELIEVGVCVNFKLDGFSPLWFATYRGHVEIVRLLLAAGADRNVENKKGRKPREVVCGGYYGQDRGHVKAAIEDMFPREASSTAEDEELIRSGYYDTVSAST